MKRRVQESCTKIGKGTGKALKELGSTTRKMRRSRSADLYIISSKTAGEELKVQLRMTKLENADILEMVTVAAVASLLFDVVECTQKVAEAVYDLADLAGFKNTDAAVSPESNLVQVQPGSQHVITISE